MISNDSKRKLPIPVDFYFDLYRNSYWIPYVHQCIFEYLSILIDAFDSMILGFIIRAHQQLDFLAIRISKIPEMIDDVLFENPDERRLNIKKKILSKIIKQHQKIFE